MRCELCGTNAARGLSSTKEHVALGLHEAIWCLWCARRWERAATLDFDRWNVELGFDLRR